METEISQLNLKYEALRLKDPARERALLPSIQSEGFREPLACACALNKDPVLIDGFKRCRCALKLKIKTVPIISIGENEIIAIFQLLRNHLTRSLNILEQAALVDELHNKQGLSLSDIGSRLDRSKAWVSVRLGMHSEMSDTVSKSIFEGKLSARSYMYTIRPFTRVNGISKTEVDDFVNTVRGIDISSRDLHTLANAYFRGNDRLKEQIKSGNIEWTLRQLKKTDPLAEANAKEFSEFEEKVLRDLHLNQKYMGRLVMELEDNRLKSKAFWNAATLVAKGIASCLPIFSDYLKRFYAGR